MGKKLGVFLLVFAMVAVVVAPTTTHAQSTDDLIARMNAIVVEMDALKREFETLKNQLSGSSSNTVTSSQNSGVGAVLGAATTNLQAAVKFGDTNDTIEKVQRLLATDPAIYDHPYVTGYFGPATEASIKRLQTRFGLDPVGIVGPATADLIMSFFLAYPGESYPPNVLATRPTTPTPAVQGASVTVPQTSYSSTPVANNPAQSIDVTFDDGVIKVIIRYTDGDKDSFMLKASSESDAVAAIARVTDLTKAQIAAVADFGEAEDEEDNVSKRDANDMIGEATDAFDDAEDEIDDADFDGDDVDYAEELLGDAEDELTDAEDDYDDGDYESAYKKAKKARSLAKDAVDAIGKKSDGDSEEVVEIQVEVTGEDDARVDVEFGDGSDDRFDVEEDQRENIIEEVADELDISEREVEDVIEFDYGDLDDVDVQIEDGEARVRVTYESGVEERFVIDEDSESDMIEEIADTIDARERDVEDVIYFDYRD